MDGGSGGGPGAGAGGSGAGGTGGASDAQDRGIDAPSLPGTGVAFFDSAIEGFAIDPYHDPTYTNLADGDKPSVPPPTLSFDATQGSPSPGSLQISAPFSGATQFVEIYKSFSVSAPLDWSGMILHVRLKVSQGTFYGYVQPYVVTNSVYAFGGTNTTVGTSSDWQDFTLDVSDPMIRVAGYDPAKVVIVGVQLNTGGVFAGVAPVVFNVDSFYLTPRPVVDASPDGG